MESTDVNSYIPYTKANACDLVKRLTDLFASLPTVPSKDDLCIRYRNLDGRLRILNSGCADKYLYWASHLGYRILDGQTAYSCDFLPDWFRKFVCSEELVIVMPSRDVDNKIHGVTVRSVFSKSFRAFTPFPYVPYGFLTSDKPYHKPWLLVESAFDSDWLRCFYPYTIASGGVSGMNLEMLTLVSQTAPRCVVAFDNDDAGDTGYSRLNTKMKFSRKPPTVERVYSPYKKDFGDVAQLALNNDSMYKVYKNVVLDLLHVSGLV